MEDNRIQNQIAIYMTNKKLCEFTDKLKPAPIEYYAHMHAQGEEQADGIRAYSCIGVVLQDYSNGTGDKTVRVTANLSPGFFPFVLSRMQNDLDRFDFTEDKPFDDPVFMDLLELVVRKLEVNALEIDREFIHELDALYLFLDEQLDIRKLQKRLTEENRA